MDFNQFIVVVFMVTVTPALTQQLCRQSADVIFVIDVSYSITHPRFYGYVLPFIQNVISDFDIGPADNQMQVGAVLFSDKVRLAFHLNDFRNRPSLLQAVSEIYYYGGETFTHEALAYVNSNMFTWENGGRPNAGKIVILVTDGRSYSSSKTLAEAETIRSNGGIIFAVGVGMADEKELRGIANFPPEQYVYYVSEFQSLNSIKDALSGNTCMAAPMYKDFESTSLLWYNQPPETFMTPAPFTDNPFNQPPVFNDNLFEQPPVYTDNPFNQPPVLDTTGTRSVCRPQAADVIFVIDESDSIGIDTFHREVLPFIENIVSEFDVGPLENQVHVGVVLFGGWARVGLNLNAHLNKTTLLAAISQLTYQGGTTNIHRALKVVRENMLTVFNGARPGVPTFIVILTDGRTVESRRAVEEADTLRQRGARVMSVGVAEADSDQLGRISDKPKSENVFYVSGFDALSGLKSEITSRIVVCVQVFESFTPS
ncbi:collagen alpha-1(XIV) chain-like [Physella acuta]|uniref:collagen alpha-1(XIV) chain-like n=1 Tax=Physella acuta TaxID=109671 RepID=UPI0027DBA5D5|nr:collagen alpha-1(XIV) chain-like [Physella acuta]